MKKTVFFLLFFSNLLIATAQDQDTTTFLVKVDYSKNFGELITAGKYDFIYYDINHKNFPIKIIKDSSKIIKMRLFCYNFYDTLSVGEIISEMKCYGCRPATFLELASFGIAQPRMQTIYSIVAFGSSFYGIDETLQVPFLSEDQGARGFYTYYLHSAWHGNTHYLAVCED